MTGISINILCFMMTQPSLNIQRHWLITLTFLFVFSALPQPTYEPRAVVTQTGHVTIVPVTRYQTDDCRQDEDIIRCRFKVGSWTYNGDELGLELGSPNIDMSTFKQNDKYEVVGNKARRKVQKYACCPEEYVTLIYTIKLKARQ